MVETYNLGVAPSQDASDHQDDNYIFRIGDPELNFHFPLASWEGATPNVYSNPKFSRSHRQGEIVEKHRDFLES